MGERTICSVRVRLLVKVIAWIQICLSVLMALFFAPMLLGLIETGWKPQISGMTALVFIQVFGTEINLLHPGIFLLADSIITLMFGIYLLKGVNQFRPLYLHFWILHTGCCCVFNIVMGLEDPTEGSGGRIINTMMVYGTEIFVVGLFSHDIRKNRYHQIIQAEQQKQVTASHSLPSSTTKNRKKKKGGKKNK